MSDALKDRDEEEVDRKEDSKDFPHEFQMERRTLGCWAQVSSNYM
jgi:hypothetical protein